MSIVYLISLSSPKALHQTVTILDRQRVPLLATLAPRSPEACRFQQVMWFTVRLLVWQQTLSSTCRLYIQYISAVAVAVGVSVLI